MQGAFFLDVLVLERAAVLQRPAGEDQNLLGGLEALLVLDFLTFAASIETMDSTSRVIVSRVDVVGEELQALREHRLARQRSGRRRPHAFP